MRGAVGDTEGRKGGIEEVHPKAKKTAPRKSTKKNYKKEGSEYEEKKIKR